MAELVELPEHPIAKKDKQYFDEVSKFADGEELGEFILPYLTEGETEAGVKDFEARKNRAYSMNKIFPILETHRATMAQPITIGGFEESKKEQLEDVDGFGKNAKRMFSDALFEFMKSGLYCILVEAPAEAPQTLQDETQSNFRPFQVLYEAPKIRYWSRFKDGAERGALSDLILENDPVLIDDELQRSFRRYRREQGAGFYSVTDYVMKADPSAKSDRFEEVSRVEVVGDKIPAVVHGEGRKTSFVRHVVRDSKALLNKLSSLDNTNYKQAFQRVVVFSDANFDEKKVQYVGEGIITVVPDAKGRLQEIPPGNPEALDREIDRLSTHIMRLGMFRMTQITSDDSKQQQSAEAKAKDLGILNNIYKDTLDDFERVLTQVYRLMRWYQDKNAPLDDVSVSISRDFGLVDSELELATDSLVMNWLNELDPETAHQVKKAIVARYINDMRFLADEEQNADEVRAELIEIVRAAKPTERSRSTLKDVVDSTGNFSLAGALDEEKLNTDAAA